MNNKPLILASASPRRQEILALAGIPFAVCPADGEWAPEGLSPAERVKALARSKASQVAPAHPDSLILGSDTMVVLDDAALGKPKTPEEAVTMLLSLSGRTHRVMTGVWLISTNEAGEAVKEEGFTDVAEVEFFSLCFWHPRGFLHRDGATRWAFVAFFDGFCFRFAEIMGFSGFFCNLLLRIFSIRYIIV